MSGFLKPHPPSTVSHWIASNRGPDSLDNFKSSDDLPDKADIVIVGAGIAGALLAYHLTHPEDEGHALPKGSSIVILEGGEVASSATGRNGGELAGHLAPLTFMPWAKLTRPFEQGGAGLTEDQALQIVTAEWDNYRRNCSVIHKHGLADQVDLWEGKAMTVYTTKEQLDYCLQAHAKWTKAREAAGMSDYSENQFWTDPEEAKTVSRCKDAVGCSARNAGSVHPHKLTTELLKLALASTAYNVSLYTNTPVLRLVDGGVKTPHGNIKAGKVALCTNAHTPHLFPSDSPLRKMIYPVRSQMGLITPTLPYAGSKSPATSYGFDQAYFMTSKGGIVLGAGAMDYLSAGVGKPEEFVCNVKDWELLPHCEKYLREFLPSTMIGWGEEAPGEGLTRTWTGVMGYTIDRLPYIGPMPEKDDLYLAAGFNGHGMSTTHTCCRALARQIISSEWDDDFPSPYILTQKRLDRKLKDDDYVWLVTGKKKSERESQATCQVM